MNFLMDRSRENWAKELAGLRGEAGECETGSPIAPTGDLWGTFAWLCTRGRIEGQLLLAPTTQPSILALRIRVLPAP